MNGNHLRGSFRLGLALVFLATGAALTSARPEKGPITEIKVKRFEVRDASIHELVWKLSRQYGIPVGFERLADAADKRLVYVSVNMWNTTVADVLNDICLGDRRYTWELRNETIHVFPKEHRDPVLVELLNTKVAKISLNENVSGARLTGWVERFPEVAAILHKHRLLSAIPLIPEIRPRHFPVQLDLTGATLSEILDALAKQADPKTWFLSRYGINGSLIVINFE